MTLIPPNLVAILKANGAMGRRRAAHAGFDPRPVVKLFNPLGAATWLATELDADGDTLFGLADLGFGCPELGSFSLSEINAIRLPFGLRIERDEHFEGRAPLSVWADTARRTGLIIAAETILRRRDKDAGAPVSPDAKDELPPD
ncbi:MAG: DUF2958 domain-containing protein [Sphingopyxis sp.]|nr:DUF2958 domain-containing protein [Sphingopyxis sp.]